MTKSKFWIPAIAAAALASTAAQSPAAIFAGNQLQIGWTGGTPFGSFENTGNSGPAQNTYTAPMAGTVFTTSPYASSTDERTAVQDTTITITNNGSTFVPQQWFEYLDVNDTLPDFTSMTFTIDPAHTTDANFNLANDLKVEQHALALEFAEVPTGDTVTIDVAVPEPATLTAICCGLPLLLRRRR